MVRLVFRPYTQVTRSICTSEPLRASTRVSSGFALLSIVHHLSVPTRTLLLRPADVAAETGPVVRPSSSPTSGSHLKRRNVFHFHCVQRVSYDPETRARVRLLGPCFKTGQTGYRPIRRRPLEYSSTLQTNNLTRSKNTAYAVIFSRTPSQSSKAKAPELGPPRSLNGQFGTGFITHPTPKRRCHLTSDFFTASQRSRRSTAQKCTNRGRCPLPQDFRRTNIF